MAARFEKKFLSSEEIRKLTFREMLDYVIRNNLSIEINRYDSTVSIYSEMGTLFVGEFDFDGIKECGDQICLLLSQDKILELRLYNCDLNFSNNLESFFDALQENTAITILGLRNEGFDSSGEFFSNAHLEKIRNIISNKPDLEYLDLSFIIFSPEEALKLAKICLELPALNYLGLEACCADLFLKDCKEFFRILGKSASIQTIAFEGEIHNDDLIAFSQVLEEQDSLFPALIDAPDAELHYDFDDEDDLENEEREENDRRMLACKKSLKIIDDALKVRALNRIKLKKRIDEVLGQDFIRRARKQHQLATSTVTDDDAIPISSTAITNDAVQSSSITTSSDADDHNNLLDDALESSDAARNQILQELVQRLEEVKKKINNLRGEVATVLEDQSKFGNITSSASALISTSSTSTSLSSSSSPLSSMSSLTSSLLSTSSSLSSSTDVSTSTLAGTLRDPAITTMSSAFISSASLILPLGKRTREDWGPEDENNDQQGNGTLKRPK